MHETITVRNVTISNFLSDDSVNNVHTYCTRVLNSSNLGMKKWHIPDSVSSTCITILWL